MIDASERRSRTGQPVTSTPPRSGPRRGAAGLGARGDAGRRGRGRSEDCLHLNVWAPAGAIGQDATRPVMVWIHGGGFSTGSGSSPIYDGASLAARGDTVVVSINYRLGPLGFLHLDHLDPELAGSGNLGLLDQLAALDWVQENIAAFGGDAGNVTIFGESAGGMSVSSLLAIAGDSGRFHRVIAQSGAVHNLTTSDVAAETAARVMEAAGVDSLDELMAIDPAALIAAGERVRGAGGNVLD
ncbi:MAG: carboxylesterase family protein, partial [Acidimicrobiales bacterium]